MTSTDFKSMKIDHEGFLLSEGLRVQDENFGRSLLQHMVQEPSGKVLSAYQGETLRLDAFDQPLVVQMIENESGLLLLHGPYGTRFKSDPNSLSLDIWDRFHGVTLEGLPFVFSRKAQNELFNLSGDYGDDWLMWGEQKIQTPAYYQEEDSSLRSQFWQKHYLDGTHAWDLGEPAPALIQALKSLKLSRQRIAVLGCGTGEDAAYLARQGHLVTAFDFSEAAISLAGQKHKSVPGLKFHVADIFALPEEYTGKFDLIFEHACFVAVPPSRRAALVRVWKKLLEPGGSLLGVFFLFPFRNGPPYGLTEWELQQHLGDDFQHLYWSRDTDSPAGRNELLVYSQLKRKG